jgi:hypothetical protein
MELAKPASSLLERFTKDTFPDRKLQQLWSSRQECVTSTAGPSKFKFGTHHLSTRNSFQSLPCITEAHMESSSFMMSLISTPSNFQRGEKAIDRGPGLWGKEEIGNVSKRCAGVSS